SGRISGREKDAGEYEWNIVADEGFINRLQAQRGVGPKNYVKPNSELQQIYNFKYKINTKPPFAPQKPIQIVTQQSLSSHAMDSGIERTGDIEKREVMKLSKLFQLAYDVYMCRMIPQLVIILDGEMCTSVGSCNGLLCIVEEGKYTVFIYNPATRKSNLLPCSQPSGSFAGCYGFGYDELSNDYKVVITGFGLEMATITYSFKTGKWKEIGHFPFARPLDDGKLLNGALHWVAGNYSTSADLWKIVSLDLANETYGEVLQPEHHEGNDYLRLGVSGEWLCALYTYFESPVVNVWVMKVYGVKDSWTKLASIPYVWCGHNLAPFCISEDGKLLLQFGPQLFVYDSKDSSSSVIDNACIDACIVVESLVSPFPPLGLADNNDDED
nr:hypothetical protein [Tanacetum cinerariifolium]